MFIRILQLPWRFTQNKSRDCNGSNRMAIVVTSIYAIDACHWTSFEFDFCQWSGLLDKPFIVCDLVVGQWSGLLNKPLSVTLW